MIVEKPVGRRTPLKEEVNRCLAGNDAAANPGLRAVPEGQADQNENQAYQTIRLGDLLVGRKLLLHRASEFGFRDHWIGWSLPNILTEWDSLMTFWMHGHL